MINNILYTFRIDKNGKKIIRFFKNTSNLTDSSIVKTALGGDIDRDSFSYFPPFVPSSPVLSVSSPSHPPHKEEE